MLLGLSELGSISKLVTMKMKIQFRTNCISSLMGVDAATSEASSTKFSV